MRINKEIRAEKVRVIGADGEQVGIMPLREALLRAQEEEQDLIEISPNANPPVCRIMDYGKFRYRITKKEKESKKSQHVIKIKEIKFKPNIDEHDLSTKMNHAREFISKGHKVRFTCVFRGREMLHMDIGTKVLQKACEGLSDIAVIESPMKNLGKMVMVVIAPAGKKAKE